MAFSDYKSITQVQAEYQTRYEELSFIEPAAYSPSQFFLDEFDFNQKNNGTPDYLVSKRSPLGKTMLETPIIIVVEAKKNDFEQGWGQCLAQLIAAAYINAADTPVYGIVTDGKLWEFSQFSHNTLTKQIDSYTVSDLPRLLGVTKSIFDQAINQFAIA